MLGNLFNKAKDAAAQAATAATSAANAVRGVEEVDWIHHAFPYAYTVEMFPEDSINLKRPEPPAGADPAAVQYANQWYAIWERVRDGHMAPVSAIENGDAVAASTALAQWRQQIEAALVESARLGDFNGNRTLVLGDNDMHEALDAMAVLVQDYIGERLNGEATEDTATDAIGYVLNVHTAMNNALGAFYADPTGAAARAAEDEVFASIEAMRQVDTNAPELAPIEGVSLHDYVAGAAKMQAGMNSDQISQALGVERPQWDRACTQWMQRIQSHPMTVGMEYGNLMGRPHPVLDAATPGGGGGALSGSQASRLSTDRDFYIECAAAMAAATEVGRVAETYLEQNYRVTAAEVANAGVAWMSDMRNVGSLIELQQARQKEIAAKLLAETGPGLADDIEF